LEQANDEFFVRLLKAVVGSLLVKLRVEFLLISALHPLPFVLVHCGGTELLLTGLGLRFSGVKPSAMRPAGEG
jgi:hypothetical protein